MKTDAAHCNQTDNTKFVLRTKNSKKNNTDTNVANECDREINGPFYTSSSKIILKGRERLFYVCPMNEQTVPFINLCCAFEHFILLLSLSSIGSSIIHTINEIQNNDIQIRVRHLFWCSTHIIYPSER